MYFGGDPATERLVNVVRRRDGVEQLVHVVEAEMTVLQQYPAAVAHRRRHEAPCVHLLTLTHRDRAAS